MDSRSTLNENKDKGIASNLDLDMRIFGVIILDSSVILAHMECIPVFQVPTRVLLGHIRYVTRLILVRFREQ